MWVVGEMHNIKDGVRCIGFGTAHFSFYRNTIYPYCVKSFHIIHLLFLILFSPPTFYIDHLPEQSDCLSSPHIFHYTNLTLIHPLVLHFQKVWNKIALESTKVFMIRRASYCKTYLNTMFISTSVCMATEGPYTMLGVCATK